MYISQFANKLQCKYCGKTNEAKEWPLHGDDVPFYYQTEPGNYQVKVHCPDCGKEWYVVWDNNPGTIRSISTDKPKAAEKVLDIKVETSVLKSDDTIANIEIEWKKIIQGKAPFPTLQQLQEKLGKPYFVIDITRTGYRFCKWTDFNFNVYTKANSDDIVRVQLGYDSKQVSMLGIPVSTDIIEDAKLIYKEIEQHLGVSQAEWCRWREGIISIFIHSRKGQIVAFLQGSTKLETYSISTRPAMGEAQDAVFSTAVETGNFDPSSEPLFRKDPSPRKRIRSGSFFGKIFSFLGR